MSESSGPSLQTHPTSFDTVGHHDDASHFLLPDHPPEIVDCGWQRTLGGDVLPAVFVALRNQTIRFDSSELFQNRRVAREGNTGAPSCGFCFERWSNSSLCILLSFKLDNFPLRVHHSERSITEIAVIK